MSSVRENIESALSTGGEREISKFLGDNPRFLNFAFAASIGHANYVLKEFPIGNLYRADYVVVYAYSGNWEVYFIELEPPKDVIITKRGYPSARCVGGLSQLQEWCDYFERNRAQVQRDLSRWCLEKDILGMCNDRKGDPCNHTGDYLKDVDSYIDYKFCLLIGRRANVDKTKRRKMNQHRQNHRISIGTYDRFVDIAELFDRSAEGRVDANEMFRARGWFGDL